jgi:iron(III) transport system substrate-binding protein
LTIWRQRAYRLYALGHVVDVTNFDKGINMRWKWTSVVAMTGLAGTLGLAGCGSSSDANAPKLASNIKDACALGDKEGAVYWWRSGDEADLRKEIAPFQKEHPKIKITIGLYRPNEIVQRMSAEMQGGKGAGADVVDGDLPTLDPLFQQGWVENYDWAAAGVSEDVITKVNDLPAVRISRSPIGLAYNTDKVSKSEVPTTYEDLVDSKWKGQVVYDPRGTYLQGPSVAWGADKAIAWFDDFKKTASPVAIEGGSASIEAVVQGQYKMTTSAAMDDATSLIDAGAHIGFQLLDVVPVNDYNSLLIKDSPHPNAGACFLDWWQGEEGTAERKAVEGKTNDASPEGMPATSELAILDTSEDFDNANKMIEHIAQASK